MGGCNRAFNNPELFITLAGTTASAIITETNFAIASTVCTVLNFAVKLLFHNFLFLINNRSKVQQQHRDVVTVFG